MSSDQYIHPPVLRKGDTIGIIAPSGKIVNHQAFAAGVKILHELGFNTKFPRELWPGDSYLANSDEHRVYELNAFLADPDIHAIMAARGGYGCLRIAEGVDFAPVSEDPKWFIGFSDTTILHEMLNNRGKLATAHGPVVTSLAQSCETSIREFGDFLFHGLKNWTYSDGIEIIRGEGVIEGVSCGGNLSTLLSTLGTPFAPSWQDKILFLEDTSEHGYRVDRMLTQLKFAGMLEQPVAIVLGDFSHHLDLDSNGIVSHHEAIWKRVLELVDGSTSVWANYPMGHGSRNRITPLGVTLKLDNFNGSITVS